ncbi:porin family protein [Parabacteroides bouchesdurhonensis]|uniref:porin family protein n=1 Tax=Parabacteroides bouchesdurhonensis TaxID=1936995 RepID=UPI000C83780C|nr:porin family protein [Parabacteroides bouchesdurhonensis]
MKKIALTLSFILFVFVANAQSPVSFQAKAGVGVSSLWGKNADSNAKFAYKLGVSMEYTFNNTWALQTALNFASKGGEDKEDQIGTVTMNELYLELPILAAARFNIGTNTKLIINAGPYIACGVGGKTKLDLIEKNIPTSTGYITIGGKFDVDTFGKISDGNLGCNRFDAGACLGIGIEYQKFVFALDNQLGLVNIGGDLGDIAKYLGDESFSPKNISSVLTIGYKF